MIEAPDVDRLLAEGLGDWLAGQEAVRTETRAKVRKVTIASLIAAAIVALIVLAGFGNFGAAMVTGVLLAAGGQFLAASYRDPVVKHIKQEMNQRIAAALQCDFSHEAVPGPEFLRARTYDLVPSYDRESFEDEWRGRVSGTEFGLYEATLEEWQGSGKNRRLVTVFQGVILSLRFNRGFAGATLVERQGNRLTFFGLRDSLSIEGRKLERVRMVDPRFEEDFCVWSDDQVEARYLVHPEYIERLMALEAEFNGQELRALFLGGELLVVIEARNMFESGSLDSANDRDRMTRTIQQFAALAQLAIRLNERPRG